MKNFLKIAALNAGIILVGVVAYSDGLLGLRPTDPSILRAGLSILTGLGMGAGLIGGNLRLLSPKKKVENVQELNDAQIKNLLRGYTHSEVFGPLAKAATDQADRTDAAATRAVNAIDLRFGAGTLSAERYRAVVVSAKETLQNNLKNVANRMQLFDEDEYRRLLNDKDVSMPADVRQQKALLYGKNIEDIRECVSLNEKLILKLDTLTVEVSDTDENDEKSDNLLQEITALTDELKYYR